MNNNILPPSQELALVDLMTGSTAYATAKLHLFKNDIVPNPDTELADLTPCDFSGYAAQTVTWSDAFRDADGTPISSGGEKLFIQTGATGNDVYGFYLTDSGGTTLLRSGRFADAPYPLVDAGDSLPVNVKVSLLEGLVDVAPTP